MSKIFTDDETKQFLRQWMIEDYETNPNYVERRAHNDLKIKMAQLQSQLASDYERIQNNVYDDPSVAGTEGEKSWQKILEDMLPNFDFKSKVKINLPNGTKSPEIDIVMLKKGYPKTLSEHYIPHDYVAAAFECKVTLQNKHLEKIIKTSSIIKKAFDRTGSPHKELNSPILYGVLAHSSGYKSPTKALDSILKKMKEHTNQIEHPSHMVDLFLIADSLSCSTRKLISYHKSNASEDNDIDCVYYHCLQWDNNTTDVSDIWAHPTHNIVGTFFYELFIKLAKEHSFHHFGYETFSYFRPLIGAGVKYWSVEVFSNEVLQKIKDNESPLSHDLTNEWCSTQ